MDYTIWRACERMGVKPPRVRTSWDSCDIWAQALLIAFEQIRDYENQEERIEFHQFIATALGAKVRVG